MKKLSFLLLILLTGMGCSGQPTTPTSTSTTPTSTETAPEIKTVNIVIPANIEEYQQKMTEHVQTGAPDPLPNTKFVTQAIEIPTASDPIKIAAETAAKSVYQAGGGPSEITVESLSVQNSTAYIQLNIDTNGWAGVSVAQGIVHPVVEKTLLGFAEIKTVKFAKPIVFNFSYTCPSDWKQFENLDYGGKINVNECTQVYPGSGQYSFDDGVSVKFKFVPTEVSKTERDGAMLYADTAIDRVKTQKNAKAYSLNGFSGWLALKNEQQTLTLIARRPTADGYYEVEGYAIGDTHTDAEFKTMIEDIIKTFKVK